MQELSSKTAVVTGAASGIGLGFAEAFAAQGMNVVMTDVESGPLEDAAFLRGVETTELGLREPVQLDGDPPRTVRLAR